MRKEHNNIEHIFKDKLQEFEVMPPSHLWVAISQEIAPKKEQKKSILFWYIGGGIAASLLIFSTLFFNFSTNQNHNTLVLTTQEDYCLEESLIEIPKDIPNQTILNKAPLTSGTTINKTNNHKNIAAKNSIVEPSSKTIQSTTVNDQKNNINTNYAIAEVQKQPLLGNKRPLVKKNDKKTTVPKQPISKPKELADNDILALLKSEEELPKKETQKRWSIQPQLTTFSYNSKGSSIDSSFENNPNDVETDLSYGMRIAYQATPKISVRTGISNANINITTSNVGVETSGSNPLSNLFTNNDVAIVNLDRGNSSNESSSPINDGLDVNQGGNSQDSITSGKISQQIQYFEIPVEIAYKLLDKKIGLDLIGGFSTFILSKNTSSFESTNSNTQLGETSSINNTSFSSNIGFSVDYHLIKNLKFGIEPMLKFQFNSFENEISNQPYFIGVSSGLKWNF